LEEICGRAPTLPVKITPFVSTCLFSSTYKLMLFHQQAGTQLQVLETPPLLFISIDMNPSSLTIVDKENDAQSHPKLHKSRQKPKTLTLQTPKIPMKLKKNNLR
jgi:hypothetical protein